MIPSKSGHIVQSRVRYLQYDIKGGQPLKITNWYSATFLFKSAKTAFKQRKM